MKVPEVPIAPLPPLRDYQAHLVRATSQHDSIVYLETGMGKTRVALERISQDLPSLRSAGQVAVFLAPSVPLMRQQAEVLASVPDTFTAAPLTKGPTGSATAATKCGSTDGGERGSACGAPAGPQPARPPLPADLPVIDLRRPTATPQHQHPVAAPGLPCEPPDTRAVGAAAAEDAAAAPPTGRPHTKSKRPSAAATASAAVAAAAAAASRPQSLLRVVYLGGSSAHGSWGPSKWAELIQRVDVLVCTPTVLLGALVHALIRVSDIGLLVVDEAHHCRKQHPYAVLMSEFFGRTSPTPATIGGGADGGGGGGGGDAAPRVEKPRLRILGLTASPLSPAGLQSDMAGGRLITPSERGEMAACAKRPRALALRCSLATVGLPAVAAL